MVTSIIIYEKLYKAWIKFRQGKNSRIDVKEFEYSLEKNISSIVYDIENNHYVHGVYTKFIISDPKERVINKAVVRDRVVHQYITTELEMVFDKKFIYDSYSCRTNKGVHAGVKRLECFVRSITENNFHEAWYLKCDIRKFFESVDQEILLDYVRNKIPVDIFKLYEHVIHSFSNTSHKGLPLGNVTSQISANIYMNVFDHFIKHDNCIKYYLRYTDDFVILHRDKRYLEELLVRMREFLKTHLQLDIHPHKITLKKVSQGIDFLGYVVFPCYTKIRLKTEKRILKHMKHSGKKETLESYKGFIKHGYSNKLRRKLDKLYQQNKKDP